MCVSPVRRDWPHLAHSAFVPLTVAAVRSAPSKTARSSSLPVSDESRGVALPARVCLSHLISAISRLHLSPSKLTPRKSQDANSPPNKSVPDRTEAPEERGGHIKACE